MRVSFPLVTLLYTLVSVSSLGRVDAERLLVTFRPGAARRRLGGTFTPDFSSSRFKNVETLTSERAPNQIVVLECDGSCSDEVKEMYGDNALAVEVDGEMREAGVLDDNDNGDGVSVIPAEPVVSWGLDRIDGTLDQQVNRPSTTGRGVKIYVLDTGTMGTHEEFAPGRVERGLNFIPDGAEDRGDVDCRGHGTHVASIAAGKTLGVATEATIVPLRVLNCGGYGLNSWIIKAVNHAADATGTRVIHMSLNGGPSTALDKSVEYALSQGVPVVVAAGNEDEPACYNSPSRVKGAITVGATTSTDKRSSFSNYGTCVDIWAPGSAIVGAWPSTASNTLTRLLSGTSMAAPFVTGVAATKLQQYSTLSPESLMWLLIAQGELDAISDIKDSPSVFLRMTGTGTARPTSFPSASPTHFPTRPPTGQPTGFPTSAPTNFPTRKPTGSPTVSPTSSPTASPTTRPTPSPTLPLCPTSCRCEAPSICNGEQTPTQAPTRTPTVRPSLSERPNNLYCHTRRNEELCMQYWPWCNWAKKKNLCYKRL